MGYFRRRPLCWEPSAVKGFLFYAWSRSEYSFACFTCCQTSAALLCTFLVRLTSFSSLQILSPHFLTALEAPCLSPAHLLRASHSVFYCLCACTSHQVVEHFYQFCQANGATLHSAAGSEPPVTRAASASQSVMNNISREKPEEWTPCFPHKLCVFWIFFFSERWQSTLFQISSQT